MAIDERRQSFVAMKKAENTENYFPVGNEIDFKMKR